MAANILWWASLSIEICGEILEEGNCCRNNNMKVLLAGMCGDFNVETRRPRHRVRDDVGSLICYNAPG